MEGKQFLAPPWLNKKILSEDTEDSKIILDAIEFVSKPSASSRPETINETRGIYSELSHTNSEWHNLESVWKRFMKIVFCFLKYWTVF